MSNMLETLGRIRYRPEVSSVGVMVYTGSLFAGGDFSWVLFIERADDPVGTVSLPAGRVEPGESPKQAAKRELEEETGIVISEDSLLVVFHSRSVKVGWKGLKVRDRIVYSAQVEEDRLFGHKDAWKHEYIWSPPQMRGDSWLRPGYYVDFEYNCYAREIIGNPEVCKFWAISSNALLDLVIDGGELRLGEKGFFKRNTLQDLTRWARKAYL